MNIEGIERIISAWAGETVQVVRSDLKYIAIHKGNVATITANAYDDLWKGYKQISSALHIRDGVCEPRSNNLWSFRYNRQYSIFRESVLVTRIGDNESECIGDGCTCADSGHPHRKFYNMIPTGISKMVLKNCEWQPYEWKINGKFVDENTWKGFIIGCETPPRWLGAYPETFPAEVTLPNGKKRTYDNKYMIPRCTCSIFPDNNPVKWAVEHDLKFVPGSELEKEREKYVKYLDDRKRRLALIGELNKPVEINGVPVTLSPKSASSIYRDLVFDNHGGFEFRSFSQDHPVEFA